MNFSKQCRIEDVRIYKVFSLHYVRGASRPLPAETPGQEIVSHGKTANCNFYASIFIYSEQTRYNTFICGDLEVLVGEFLQN